MNMTNRERTITAIEYWVKTRNTAFNTSEMVQMTDLDRETIVDEIIGLVATKWLVKGSKRGTYTLGSNWKNGLKKI